MRASAFKSITSTHYCTTPRDDLLAALDEAANWLDEHERNFCSALDAQLRVAEHVRALDAAARRIAALEREIEQLRLALAIARDERARAEARIAELEIALDAARLGIRDELPPPGPRRTLPPLRRPATEAAQ